MDSFKTPAQIFILILAIIDHPLNNLPLAEVFSFVLYPFSRHFHKGTNTNPFQFFYRSQATTARYLAGGQKQSTTIKPGFQLGAGAKIEFENRLYFSPAIYYSLQGYKVTLNKASSPPDVTAINNNTTVHTLETAFLIQYDFSNKPSHFYFKLGPSIDFQLIGHEKFDRVDGDRVNRSMKYGFANYGRYAVSAVIQVGYEMSNNFIFYAHYSYGLSNLNNSDTGPSIQSRVFGISVGKYLR